MKTNKSYNITLFKLLKNLDAKKAIKIDGIPPMILKLSAHILAEQNNDYE